MSNGEGDQGFVIRDRRGRGDQEGDVPDSTKERPSSRAASLSDSASQASPPPDAGPPLSFSSFVFSLGTSALMLMGEQLDPQQPKPQVNLAQAKEIIDILSILEEKTRGNLNSEEEAVLRDMLYALRMKFVNMKSGQQEPQSI